MAFKPSTASADIDFSKLTSTKSCNRNYYRLFAQKGDGKTSSTAKLRKNPGTKHLYLSADGNTNNGLVQYLMATGGVDGKPIPGADDKDRQKAVEAVEAYIAEHFIVMNTTEPYSQLRIETSIVAAKWAIKCFEAGLAAVEKGVVGSVFVHHYGKLVKMGDDLCRVMAKPNPIPRGGKLSVYKYGPRTEFLGEIDAYILEFVRLAEEGKCDSVWIVDYGAEPKIVETTDENGNDQIEEVRVMPRWARSEKSTSFLQDNTVWFEATRIESAQKFGDGSTLKTYKYTAEVVQSQHPMFKAGDSKDITGRGIDAFFGAWWDEVLARRQVK